MQKAECVFAGLALVGHNYMMAGISTKVGGLSLKLSTYFEVSPKDLVGELPYSQRVTQASCRVTAGLKDIEEL